jgi:hypothetical protein
MSAKTYPYRAKWHYGLGAMVVAGAIAWMAATGNGPPLFSGVLFWPVMALAGVLVSAGLLLFVLAVTSRRQIVLGDSEISSPAHLLQRADVVVPYRTISEVRIVTMLKRRFLQIRHAHGVLSIPEVALPRPAVFDEFNRELCSRLTGRAARPKGNARV